MSFEVLWFVVVALFWTGFFVLEGFDFGVGALHHAVGRDDLERRVAINAIGPVWDGNEVWLIVGGAAIFEDRIRMVNASGATAVPWRRIHQPSIDDHGTSG